VAGRGTRCDRRIGSLQTHDLAQLIPTPDGEQQVVRITARNLLAAEPEEVVVVTGHRRREVMGAVQGLPVTFAASRVPEVLTGTINPGCRKLLEDHPTDVVRHDFNHDRFCTDMDTPLDYESIRVRLSTLEL
jgi:CTP:molybdopterin cytidylyltransferase MocA